MATRCLFESDIKTFLEEKIEVIRDSLCNGYHGTELTTTRNAWSEEIEILKKELTQWKSNTDHIVFEYDIPRLGKRIDVVLLLKGIIFVLEFKVGQSSILENDIDQVLYYALDLRNFHKFSQDRIIVPILILFLVPLFHLHLLAHKQVRQKQIRKLFLPSYHYFCLTINLIFQYWKLSKWKFLN